MAEGAGGLAEETSLVVDDGELLFSLQETPSSRGDNPPPQEGGQGRPQEEKGKKGCGDEGPDPSGEEEGGVEREEGVEKEEKEEGAGESLEGTLGEPRRIPFHGPR